MPDKDKQRQALLGRLEAAYDKLVELGSVTESHVAKMIEQCHNVDLVTLESMVEYTENRIKRKAGKGK